MGCSRTGVPAVPCRQASVPVGDQCFDLDGQPPLRPLTRKSLRFSALVCPCASAVKICKGPSLCTLIHWDRTSPNVPATVVPAPDYNRVIGGAMKWRPERRSSPLCYSELSMAPSSITYMERSDKMSGYVFEREMWSAISSAKARRSLTISSLSGRPRDGGSLARQIIQYVDVTVLTVKNIPIEPRRLLLCLDPSDASRRARDFSIRLARTLGAPIDILCIYTYPWEEHVVLNVAEKAQRLRGSVYPTRSGYDADRSPEPF